jgi:4-amino-4-deoxy-L-arabinose transferase-like glycosyltransferase
MNNLINIYSYKKSIISILFGALILLLTPLIFGDLSIDAPFILMSIFLIISTSLFYSYFLSKIFEENFLKKIFIFGLVYRIIAVFVYYMIFKSITGTPFEVTFSDSLFYDEMGLRVAEAFKEDNFSMDWLIGIHIHTDRIGYQFLLGIIYYLTDHSIITVRLIQALVSAHTLIIAYKIGKLAWDEYTARIIAVLYAGFHPFVLYASLHLREFLLIYIFLLMLYYFLQLANSFTYKSLFYLVLFTVAMLFFRTVFVVIFLLSIAIYLLLIEKNNSNKIVKGSSIFIIFFVVLANVPYFETSWLKILGYIGYDTSVRLGGYSQELVLSRGMSLAQYIGGPLFLLPSLPFPIPSVLKLSIEGFGQSIHWYFTGSLILWTFFSGFFFIGIYKSIKNRNRPAIFLFIVILLYSVALLESFYFTSIRYNQVKIALLLLFVPSGMIYLKNKTNIYMLYVAFMVVIILGYNYLRIFGRIG